MALLRYTKNEAEIAKNLLLILFSYLYTSSRAPVSMYLIFFYKLIHLSNLYLSSKGIPNNSFLGYIIA